MSGFKPVYSWERLYGIINTGVNTAQYLLQRRKQRAHSNLKTIPVTRKEKLKWKRKPKTHPVNRAPRGVGDKSTSLIFGMQLRYNNKLSLSTQCSPSASYRTNVVVQNNPRYTKWIVTKYPVTSDRFSYQLLLLKEQAACPLPNPGRSAPRSRMTFLPFNKLHRFLKVSFLHIMLFLKELLPALTPAHTHSTDSVYRRTQLHYHYCPTYQK